MGIAERKTRDFKRREQDILAAAVALIHERDIETVTIAEVAEQAEIGKGTVYKHFRSKEEIIARILLGVRQRIHGELQRELVAGLGPAAVLRKIIGVYWRLHLEDPLFHLRMHSYVEKENFIARIRPELAKELRAAQNSILALFSEFIQEGIKQGHFENGDVNQMLWAAGAAVAGAIRLALSASSGYRGLFQREDFHQYLADFILKGLGWKGETKGAKGRPTAKASRRR